MKTFILTSIITASLFANVAQGISCPNITVNKKNGETITVGDLTWEVIVTPKDSTSGIVTWQPRDNHYTYHTHIGRPACKYRADEILIGSVGLYLITSDAYNCTEPLPRKPECATNSFVLKED